MARFRLMILAALVLVGTGNPVAASASAEPPVTFTRCYFPASFFCQELSPKVPLDPQSPAMVQELRNMAFGVPPSTSFDCRHAVMTQPTYWTQAEKENCQKVVTPAGLAYDAYAPMLYTVSQGQPLVPVTLDINNPNLKAAFAAGVPIPAEAQPAGGTDGQLIIYQPSSDTMWEFWRAAKDAQGAWHASWGGVIRNVSQNPGHYEDILDHGRTSCVRPDSKSKAPAIAAGAVVEWIACVLTRSAETNSQSETPSDSDYLQHHTWGGPASSIPNLPGLITVEQLRSGVIGHALGFSTWSNKVGSWVYPAQRTDGKCRGPQLQYCSSIPQGARFRLDPSFDVGKIKHPITRMIAQALQDYGMVLYDSTGGGTGFYMEGWRGHPDWTDPYYGSNGLFLSDPRQIQPTLFLRELPWERLQMIKPGPTCTDSTVPCTEPEGWDKGTWGARQ